MLLILLGFKLLGSVHIGIGDLETVDDHPDAADKIHNERLFVDTVTVLESVPVKQDVAGDNFPVSGKEEVDAETEFNGVHLMVVPAVEPHPHV